MRKIFFYCALSIMLSACGGGSESPSVELVSSISANSSQAVNSSIGSSTRSSQSFVSSDVSSTNSLVVSSARSSQSSFVSSDVSSTNSLIASSIRSSQASSVSSLVSSQVLSVVNSENTLLVPINTDVDITVNFSGISADQILWEIESDSGDQDASITPTSNTNTSATFKFNASVAQQFEVKFFSQNYIAQVDLVIDVHPVYVAGDSYSQRRILLGTDGLIKGEGTPFPADQMKTIAQGFQFGAGVRLDGSVVSWGNITAPVPSGLANVSQVVAGDYYSIAIKEDGKIAVWGKINNHDAILSNDLQSKTFISAGVTNSGFVAVEANGNLIAFYGDGSIGENPEWQGNKFKKVCATAWHIVTITEANELKIWKWLSYSDKDPAMEVLPITTAPIKDIFCGSGQAGLIQTDGRVMTWGEGVNPFDSSLLNGFPNVKTILLYSYVSPYFITEGGALINSNMQLVRNYD